jgi:hypothetical protein
MFHGRGYPARCFLEVAVGSVERFEWATRSAPWKVPSQASARLYHRRRTIPFGLAATWDRRGRGASTFLKAALYSRCPGSQILLSPDLYRPTIVGGPARGSDLDRSVQVRPFEQALRLVVPQP